MGNMPGGQVSIDGLLWVRGNGRVEVEPVVYLEICGPDSALLVEVALVPAQLAAVRSSPSSRCLGQRSVTAAGGTHFKG